jgi:hypothetical protein
MNGNEQNLVLARECADNFFSPVAVMGVEVEYCNSLATALQRMHSSNGDAVENTKPAADTVLQQTLDAAVMTGWTNGAKRILALSV